MKQTVFMIVATLMGTVGVYTVNAFWGIAVYDLFAVLRPQFMWEWSLPADVSWSFYVALCTIGAGLAASLGILKVDGISHVRWTFAHLCVLAFGAWITITYFTAQHKDVAYPTFIEYMKIFVMFIMATILTRKIGQLWILMVLSASSLAYIAYEVNYLYLVNHYLGIQRNGYGGLDNNGAGLMLAMGVPLCWFVYQGSDKWWRWVFLLLIPAQIHAVLMTYSRGAMVSLLLACPLIWLRSRNRVMLGLLGLLLGVVLIPTMAGAEIRARFLTLQTYEQDASANSRKDSWMAAVRITSDYPVFGVGIRNSPLYSHRYGADFEGRVIHSNYLQIAADNGVIGLGLLLLMFLFAFRGANRARQAANVLDGPEKRRINAIASGVQCSLCVFCIGSIFLSLEVFELPYILVFLAAQLPMLSDAAFQASDRFSAVASFDEIPATSFNPHTAYDDPKCFDHAAL